MEANAGEGASYSDHDYSEAGAKIVHTKKEVFECDILVKSAYNRFWNFRRYNCPSKYIHG
jgi:alanine dehydrogenase